MGEPVPYDQMKKMQKCIIAKRPTDEKPQSDKLNFHFDSPNFIFLFDLRFFNQFSFSYQSLKLKKSLSLFN